MVWSSGRGHVTLHPNPRDLALPGDDLLTALLYNEWLVDDLL